MPWRLLLSNVKMNFKIYSIKTETKIFVLFIQFIQKRGFNTLMSIIEKTEDSIIFIRDTSREKPKVFLIPLALVSLFQVYMYSSIPVSVIATLFISAAIFSFFRIAKLPFVIIDNNYLSLRSQLVLPAKKIPWDNIKGVKIANNFSRTITITMHRGQDYQCHGWGLNPDDDARFIDVIEKRIANNN